MNDDEKRVVDALYAAYGSDSGCLFGLRPDQRSIAEAIVIATLRLSK